MLAISHFLSSFRDESRMNEESIFFRFTLIHQDLAVIFYIEIFGFKEYRLAKD